MRLPPPRPIVIGVAAVLLCLWFILAPIRARAHPIDWVWPVARVAIERDFVGPTHAYGPGHRGIDLTAHPNDAVVAPADGIVSFAGSVANTPILSLDHGNGWVSSFVSVRTSLSVGDKVTRGSDIGIVESSWAHCTCLHFGVRYRGQYLNPLILLGQVPAAVLLPW